MSVHYRQMTQGVYMSPLCPLKQDSQPVAGTVIGAEFGSEFERHLISYFQAYGPDLSALRKQVALYDWSQCKVNKKRVSSMKNDIMLI